MPTNSPEYQRSWRARKKAEKLLARNQPVPVEDHEANVARVVVDQETIAAQFVRITELVEQNAVLTSEVYRLKQLLADRGTVLVPDADPLFGHFGTPKAAPKPRRK